jgi:hypothetical protein
LQGFRPGQQHAEIERAGELSLVQPAAPLDDFAMQDGDLARGAAEGNEAEADPEARGCRERDALTRRAADLSRKRER